MGGSELTLKTKSKEKSSDRQINWKEWLSWRSIKLFGVDLEDV
jgi:hypothetical protein